MTGPILDSASTLLVPGLESDRVYLVLRAPTHRAFPDCWVFPGGRIESGDGTLPVAGAVPDGLRPALGAAARELFEETGVLVACGPGGGAPGPDRLPGLRSDLLAGRSGFAEILGRLGVAIEAGRFRPLGVKTTPPFAAARFRNRFFMATLPAGQQPRILPGELAEGRWMSPRQAVAAFETGSLPLAPPVLIILEVWGDRPAGEAVAVLAGFSDETVAHVALPIRFTPQVILVPGRTPTLPPATHTNGYIIGDDRLLLVDPATPDHDDQQRLIGLLDRMAGAGRRLEAIVLTHHHEDHVGAVEPVVETTGAPVWAHRRTADHLPRLLVSRRLEDGEVLDLGRGGQVRVLHTPGHASGHICLFQESFGALVAGDMVSTLSTIIVDPPDGDMGLYLDSLRRLSELPARYLYPAHGPPTPRTASVLAHYLEHRRQREEKTLAALDATPRPLERLVGVIYDDVPAALHPLAARSLLAGLLKLEREGLAARDPRNAWMRSR